MKNRAIVILFLFIVNLYGYDATIEISKNLENRSKIALYDASGYKSEISRQIYDMLVADFKTTGHFLIQEGYKREDSTQSTDNKDYDYIIKYKISEGQRLHLDLDIYKTPNNQLIEKKSFYISSRERYPFIAHSAVASINKYFGYADVDWMTNYVIFAKKTGLNRSDIFISDYTLTFQQKVISGGMNIFPKWADDKKEEFYYTSLNANLPVLYKVNLYTGKREKILENEGMLVCSDTRKNGEELLLTLAHNDQPEVYLYNVNTKRKKRLTYYSGIDVNAQFVDTNDIVFVSDRLGYPNIYKKNIDASEVRQIVYHGRNNHAVTAHNNYMVYVSRDSDNAFSNNSFNLYLISTKSSYIRPLTASGVNQFPKFSANGDTVLFIKNYENESALGIIRINQNKSYLFPLKGQKLQSIDW